MHRVFCLERFVVGKILPIEMNEVHHIVNVLRLAPGARIELFDGHGNFAEAKIVQIRKKECVVEILLIRSSETQNHVSVAFAIPKAQALDFIFHRCTEVGTYEFIPLITDHSLHPNSWNSERWKKVIIEVCRQCQSDYLPTLYEPVSLKEWIKNRSSNQRSLLFCDEQHREKERVFIQNEGRVELLIGPEGGWSSLERELIIASGASHFSLGANRLRSETAAFVALILAKKLIGEI